MKSDDFISRQAAAEAIYRALKTPVPDYRKDPFHDTIGLAFAMANEIPSAEPEIIRCGECVNHLGNRCLKADHHTNDIECCMSVFGAERKTDEAD